LKKISFLDPHFARHTMATLFDSNKIKVILRKAIAVNSKPTPETFPELPTVLIWFRCVLAIAYGTYLGSGSVSGKMLRGGTMMLHTLNLIAFIPVMYCRLWLGTQVEGYGLQLLTAGLFPALALAMLLWIYFFTAAHEESEGKLAAMLISTLLSNNETMDDSTAGLADTTALPVETTSDMSEESEF
jgi:hypothetical protein